jgi:1-deoxy-D-xylulose-5-phosphate synthase
VVTVEENVVSGGFGSSIKEALEGMPFDVKAIGIPDKFIEQGSQTQLRKLVGLDAAGLTETLRRIHSGTWSLPKSLN